MNKTVLVLDRDRDTAAKAATQLASADRLVLTGCDADVGTLVMARVPLTSLVTELHIEGPFSYEGLDLVGRARRSTPDCRVVVTTEGAVPSIITNEIRRRGAAGLLRKPLNAQQLRRTCNADDCDGQGTVLHIPTVDELIASDHLSPAFQPIVDLAHPERPGFAFESLARYRGSSPFCDPEFLFQYARLRGRTADLELACIRRTLREARSLPQTAKIFINIHPQVLAEGTRLAATLINESAANGIDLSQVVLELTEQEKLEASPVALTTIDHLRALGVRFAIDDVGTSYSHIDLIDRIKPSYLKIAHSFGTDFEKDATRGKIIRNILSLARDFDCEVVLEGIETAATSGAAADIGARYAQGFYYARPQTAAAFAGADA